MSNPTPLSPAVKAQAAQIVRDADLAFKVLRETNSFSASGTISFLERIPGEDLLVAVGYPDPWAGSPPSQGVIYDLNGVLQAGDPRLGGGAGRFAKLFREHPEVTTVSHVHSVYLGAWSQSHRPLPILYVPVQRHTFLREIPIYIDRRQEEVDYILERLGETPDLRAILEANGGSTVWGFKGLIDTAKYIQLLEEGAQLQALAEGLGGSKEYGPGVLEQQWRMTGLIARTAVAAE